jgi:hypothetical protein
MNKKCRENGVGAGQLEISLGTALDLTTQRREDKRRTKRW